MKYIAYLMVLNTSCLFANSSLPKEYYGEWKAFSKACITDSILNISKDSLDWKTKNHNEKYEYFDSSKKYPIAENVAEGNVRHTLKIIKSRDLVKNSLNLISLAIYNDTDKYSMFKKDAPLLGVWWHYYDDKPHYLSEKKIGTRNGSWCLFTK